MAIEDHKERRGEPVCIDIDRGKNGTSTLEGTVEWGNDREGYSVATEPAGARYQVQAKDMRSDPGGVRPLWARRNPPKE